jgi:hypothetical protein
LSTTPKAARRYPATSAAVNVPQDIQNLATDLEDIGPNYASTGARDTANPSPATGDTCRVAGVNYIYRSSAWNLVADAGQGPAWTNMTLSSGWSAAYSGAPAPAYRLFAGKIEFKGVSTYTGAMTTAGIQLCTAIPAVASAVPASATNHHRITITGMTTTGADTNSVPGFTARLLTDGRIFVHPPASQTNAVVNFEGASISQ